MDPIIEVSRRHDLAIIEDAAQAIGAEYGGHRAGSIGLAGCLFLPTKNLRSLLGKAGTIHIIMS